MPNPSTAKWIANIRIGRLERNLSNLVKKFEWKSQSNSGFVVRARLEDPYFTTLQDVIEGGGNLLKTVRQHNSPTLVRFNLQWDGGIISPERIAIITDIRASGNSEFNGEFEFIAVDPISYYINSGNSSGKAFKGKIGGAGGVIDQVIRLYVENDLTKINIPKFPRFKLNVEVDDTDDQENIYYQMRMDPKTFIRSLLEWSSSLTKKKTNWSVRTGQDDADIGNLYIRVTENYNNRLIWPKNINDDGSITQDRPMVIRYGGTQQNPIADVLSWEFLSSNFISVLNTKVTTSGMSAISGEYLDIITDNNENSVFVKDSNTNNKSNVKISENEGYAKPIDDSRGWTNVSSVPEHNVGDVGVKYKEYIDGRARNAYLSTLNLNMRIKVTVRGQPRLFDSSDLGSCKIKIKWLKAVPDESGQSRFIDGDWMLDGWHHKLSSAGGWTTEIYLSRLDYNAEAIG